MPRLARGRAGQPDGGADRTRLAVGLVLSAALCFVATDGAAKYLSAGMSAPQILWIRNGVVLAILIPLVWRAGGRRRLRTGRLCCKIRPESVNCLRWLERGVGA